VLVLDFNVWVPKHKELRTCLFYVIHTKEPIFDHDKLDVYALELQFVTSRKEEKPISQQALAS
jgi:hypothetical protein